jgi:hypothetical protein
MASALIGLVKWYQSNLITLCDTGLLYDVVLDEDVKDLRGDIVTTQSYIRKINSPHKVS